MINNINNIVNKQKYYQHLYLIKNNTSISNYQTTNTTLTT